VSKALFVIDMLRAFLEPGRPLFCGESARAIVPFVTAKVREFSEAGETIYFVCDSHDPDDAEFERFPPHAIRGTEEARLIEELEPFAEDGLFVYKRRFSAFFETPLDEMLAAGRPDLADVVGVCTNICVLYTVEELRNRDIPVRIHRGGVAGFDEKAHEWALSEMEKVLGAEIAD